MCGFHFAPKTRRRRADLDFDAGKAFTLTTAIRLEVALALIPEKRLASAMPYGRITPGMPAFASCRAMLAQVGDEGYATFFACPD